MAAHWGLREISGLLVPPVKAFNLLTDHLITGQPLMSEPAQENKNSKLRSFKSSEHINERRNGPYTVSTIKVSSVTL